MTFTVKGSGEPSTIIDGVLMMVHHGMIPIALIVFIASICVPFLKLAGLATLLLSVQFKWKTSHRQRTTMYTLIETIGRWSMLDVFVHSCFWGPGRTGDACKCQGRAGRDLFLRSGGHHYICS